MADDDDPLLQPPTHSELRRIVGDTPSSERVTQPALPADVAGAPPAMRMGKFIRVAKVGAGGMGEVWKAWDRDLGRWVALKILKSSDEEEVVRFAREAHIAGKLSHPYIAQIFEIGEDQGRRFIAMQYIDGLTLRAVARGDGVRLVRLISDAARAVAYAHGQGIIHRDIKPENLMVRQQAKDLHLFVMDFGLARSVSSDARLSLSGTVVGTPAYMPPEQARGQRVDERADVYSLGATLYELLARRPPFVGKDIFDILEKVQNQAPPPLPRVAPDLATVIFKCLEKEPGRRYQTANEFADDLDRWMRSEPVRARRPSIGYRLSKWLGRRLAVAILAAVVVVMLASAGAAYLVTAANRDREFAAAMTDGRAQETGGKLEKAMECYQRASRYRQDRGVDQAIARVQTEIDRRRGELEQKEQALKELESARSTLDQATAVLYSATAPLEELDRLTAQALARIRPVVERQPRLALAHYLLGLGHELRNEDADAETAWKAALTIDPDFAAAKYRLARLMLGRVWLARSYTEEDGPDKARIAAEAIAVEARRLLSSAKLDDELQAELARALIAFSQDDLPEARRIAATAAGRAGDRRGAEDLLWLAGLLAPDPASGMPLLDRALAIRPKFPVALVARAWNRRCVLDVDSAIADLDEAIRLHPRLFCAYMNRAVLLHARSDTAAALRDYETATQLSPTSGLAWTNLGHVRVQMRDPLGAATAFREAIRVQPSLARAHLELGCLLKAGGDRDGALHEWNEAIRIKPDYADARINRGNARMQGADFQGALEDYDAAVKGAPKDPEALAYRAAALHSLGKPDLALADLEKAMLIAPADWPLRGRIQQMIDALKK